MGIKFIDFLSTNRQKRNMREKWKSLRGFFSLFESWKYTERFLKVKMPVSNFHFVSHLWPRGRSWESSCWLPMEIIDFSVFHRVLCFIWVYPVFNDLSFLSRYVFTSLIFANKYSLTHLYLAKFLARSRILRWK